ncbi:hypothetical protein ASE55_03940 [Chryseobacterium sp. Leaf201]|nr:hypothetical protein ASE55_03940 [Chryseobacterium sp. Leaf201]
MLGFLLSCTKEPEMKIRNDPWEKLQVNTDFQKITIDRHSDSAEVVNIIWNKEIYNIPPKYIVEDTVTTKIYLSRIEKDSLKNWIRSSILNPQFTDLYATDYVGNVELKYIDRGTTLSCTYNSVGEWDKVSENTKKIYNLLSSKTKLSRQ